FLLRDTAAAVDSTGVSPFRARCSLAARAPISEQFPPGSWQLFRRIRSAIVSLYSEPKSLLRARSKPPDMAADQSNEFRGCWNRVENYWACLFRKSARH